MALHEEGILQKYGVELIGAKAEAIRKGEDREAFQEAMQRIGLRGAQGAACGERRGGPPLRPGGGLPRGRPPLLHPGRHGGGIAHDEAELVEVLSRGLTLSPVHTALVEESVLGWKEFELEVMRDHADTVVIITSIENVDPMGVHTGDSITVAPAQTLSDVEYQRMRDAAKAIIREIGVETGGPTSSSPWTRRRAARWSLR